MGLDTTHDCWHGPYSAFMRWRKWLAEQAGYPPLEWMDGFQGSGMPPPPKVLSWEPFRFDPLHILLSHSDCDGEIRAKDCRSIANRLRQILRKANALEDGDSKQPRRADYDGNVQALKAWIKGLLAAYKAGENVRFH